MKRKVISQPAPSPEVAEKMDRMQADMAQADARAAASFAPDYVEVKGVRLYRAKICHKWVMGYIGSDPRYAGMQENQMEMVVAMSYLLIHEQPDVRNKLMREARKGEFIDAAWRWIMSSGLSPEDLAAAVEELRPDLESPDDKEEAAGNSGQGESATPSGGVE